MATYFDALDQQMSVAVGEAFGEPVTWRPMVAPRNLYTRGSSAPDPVRPIVIGVNAIITWRPGISSPSATDPMQGTQRGALESFDVAIDVLVSDFPSGGLPREGDIFEFSRPYYDNPFGVVARQLNDGTARAVFFCLGVGADDVNI